MHRRNTSFRVVGAALALAALPVFAHAQIVNGSFEAPLGLNPGSFGLYDTIPGWTALKNTSHPGKIEIQRENIAGTTPFGEQFLELDSNASAHVYQDIATVVDRFYDVAFWYSKRAGVGDNSFIFDFGGQSTSFTLLDTVTNPVNPEWRLYSATLKATSNNTRISFINNNPSDSLGAYIDNVSVSESQGGGPNAVPEPGEWAAMGVLASGLAGLVLRARRRRG